MFLQHSSLQHHEIHTYLCFFSLLFLLVAFYWQFNCDRKYLPGQVLHKRDLKKANVVTDLSYTKTSTQGGSSFLLRNIMNIQL